MARYPDAIWKPKPHQSQEGMITPRVVIVHSICGGYKDPGLAGLDWLEDPNNPLESTFALDGDGTVYQLRDTHWHCDANLDANDFSISIETESTIEAEEEWNPVQYDALVRLVKWCCIEHRIPMREALAWNGEGVGYHTMWGAPSHWTPVAKKCPGTARIAQFPQLVADVAAPNMPEVGVSVADVDAWMRARHDLPGGTKGVTMVELLEQWPAYMSAVRSDMAAMKQQMAELKTAIATLVAAQPEK